MNNTILLFCEYNDENYSLAKKICSEQSSVAVFYIKENTEMADYYTVISRSYEKNNNRFIMLKNSIYDEGMILEIENLILDLKIQPDIFISKGNILDFYPLSAIKKNSGTNIPLIGILENFIDEDLDKDILEQYNTIRSFKKNNIIKNMNEDFSVDFYKKSTDKCLENITTFCSKNNYDDIKCILEKNGIKSSIVCNEILEDMERSLYIQLSNIVIDETGDDFFPIICSRLLKKPMKIEEIVHQKGDYTTEIDKDLLLEDFSFYLYKEIKSEIQNILDEPLIVKSEEIKI